MKIRLQAKQEGFLSSPADICIGGGAAGGGKTYSLLLEPIRHVKRQGFNSIMLRRTYPEIKKSGGVWDEAKSLYPMLGGTPNEGDLDYEFSRYSSKIGFGHLTNEATLDDWKSAQIALLMFDQLETFTERMFFYMLSRNRTTCGISSYCRATANPEPGWLADFLDWWIAEDGYADMDRAGKMRAFVRLPSDELVWADSKEDLLAKYPEYQPKTVTFVPFTIYDNDILMQKDPGYLASLQALSYVDRERLLGDPVRGGNWKIKPSAGKVFNKDWFEIVDSIPEGGVMCRYFDFAGTEKKTFKDDPDYTTGVLMLEKDKTWYIIGLYHQQIAASVTDQITDKVFIEDAERYLSEGRQYMARWEIEPASAAKRDNSARIRRLAGIDAKGVSKTTDKLMNWKPAAAQAEAGHIKILKGAWNQILLNELHGAPDLPHDDIPDAVAGAFLALTNTKVRKASYHRG